MTFRIKPTRFLTVLAALLLVACAAPGALQAQLQTQLAYEVKAAFVYNFLKFIEWPQESLPPVGSEIVLGIVGEDELTELLLAAEGREAQGRTVRVWRLSPGDDLARCHCVYIASSEQRRLPRILALLEGRPIFTVGDVHRFIESGGMANFLIEGDRIRFEICDERARKAGLKLSAKLLQVARPVECKTN